MNFKILELILALISIQQAFYLCKTQLQSFFSSDGFFLKLTLEDVAKSNGRIFSTKNAQLLTEKSIFSTFDFLIEKLNSSEKIPLNFKYNFSALKSNELFFVSLKDNAICLLVEKSCHRE